MLEMTMGSLLLFLEIGFWVEVVGESGRENGDEKNGVSFFLLLPSPPSKQTKTTTTTTTTPRPHSLYLSLLLPEHRPVEDVPDRPVGALPHLLEPKLLDARLVRRDRRALDADAVLQDRVGGVDGHLVVGGVAVREAEVVVLDREVEVGEDELLLDLGPDDAEKRERWFFFSRVFLEFFFSI